MFKYIHVSVTAGARKEKLSEMKPDHFDIAVKEKAERNMANNRVLELVALHLQVPTSSVRIVNGHMHPKKLLVCEMPEKGVE